MGRRTLFLLPLLAVAALTACGEAEEERDAVTGPDLRPAPPANACDFNGLSGLIRDYFPGPRQNVIVGLKDAMAAEGPHTPLARDYGFRIMDSIGYLSRDLSVDSDPAAGALLTVGLIKCMFSRADTITYPTTALADFTSALTRDNGGAYYVRGAGAGSNSTVLGTDWTAPADPTNLSGLRPADGSTCGTTRSSSDGTLSGQASCSTRCT